MKKLFLLTGMLTLFFVLNAYSVCCGPPLGGHYACADGKYTWTCCGSHSGGYGGCNIFCCDLGK